MVGIYPQAALDAYDVDLSGRLTLGELVQGIDTAANLGRVVINLSLGSTEFDQVLEDVVFSAFRRGALIVAASGNSGANGPLNYPANFPHVLTVAAADTLDRPADFSSASQGVDLIAPGVAITVAVPLLYDVRAFQSAGRHELLRADRLRRHGARLDRPRRPRQHADLRPHALLRPRRLEARVRPGERLRHARPPERARSSRSPWPTSHEPNDDVRLVKPRGLFAEGTPPLTSRSTARASLRASLDANEDPADLYRVWIPARRRVTVTTRSTHAMRVRVWAPGTRSIAETGAAARRDLAASSTTRVRVSNTSTRGGYYYADVRLARGIRSGTYLLSVTTGALAKR